MTLLTTFLLWVSFTYVHALQSISLEEIITLKVDNMVDSTGQPVTPPSIIINDNDLEEAQLFAQSNLPAIDILNPGESEYYAGIEVSEGELAGAMIYYDSSEPITPSFGPISDVKPPVLLNGDTAVGVPANLIPHTVFDNPVKIFIPCPGVSDISKLKFYYFNGIEWLLACDANGNYLPDGEGWIVPGSRVNHNDTSPPMIEFKAYHFSATQAVASANTAQSGSGNTAAFSSGGGGGCFIEAVNQNLNDNRALSNPLVYSLIVAVVVTLTRLNSMRPFFLRNRTIIICIKSNFYVCLNLV